MQLMESYSPKAAFIFADYFNLALECQDGHVNVLPKDLPDINELKKRHGFIQWCEKNQRKLFDEDDGLPMMRHTETNVSDPAWPAEDVQVQYLLPCWYPTKCVTRHCRMQTEWPSRIACLECSD